jgi:hypothetical protein
MLGWIMIFALFVLSGTVLTLVSPAAQTESVTVAIIVFAALLCLSVITRIIRGRV